MTVEERFMAKVNADPNSGCWLYSRLREAQIPEIRRRLHQGDSINAVAKAFGVSSTSISAIKQGKVWRHVGA